MRELIYIASHWLHLVATVVWIGGIAFVLMVAMPSAKQVLGADANKLMGEVSKRFTLLANKCTVILIITGIILTVFNNRFSEMNFGNGLNQILALKHVIVVGMVIIHFYRGLILVPKIVKTTSPAKEGLQKLSMRMVKVNFGLGLFVLLLSGLSGRAV